MTAPAAVATAAPGCSPRVIDLGTLGGANSGIDGDNGRDTFVGEADSASGERRAVLFRPDGTIVDLGEPNAVASDMNSGGIVVGDANVLTPQQFSFAWYHGRAVRLRLSRWATTSHVRRVNGWGDAAGSVFDRQGHSHPAVWIRLSFVHVLPIPRGYTDAEVLGINDRGEMVGDASAPSNNPDGFEQDAWWWREDGSNGALRPDYRGGGEQANVVNERGWAAGGLDYGGKIGLWPAVWRDGTLTRLGPTGPGIQFGFAYGGDEIGDYVGNAAYSPSDQYAHVFLTHIGSHVLYTLRPLSGNLRDPSNAHAVIPDVSGLGIVVGGDSTTANGNDHATLWTCAWKQVIRPAATSSGAAAPVAQLRGAEASRLR
jgi:hypothetical protein